jgi:hypothetical protein
MSEVSIANSPKLEKDFAGKQAPFHETRLNNHKTKAHGAAMSLCFD